MASGVLVPTAASATARRWLVLRLVLGVVAVGLGVVVLAWPEATVKVVGALFGLNLLVSGLGRVVFSLVEEDLVLFHRVLTVVFGVIVAVLGIVCLRHVLGSALLYVLVIGIGWLLEGLVEVVHGVVDRTDSVRGWRIVLGLGYMLAAIVVLVWPSISLGLFLAVGAGILIVVGLVNLVDAARVLRALRAASA